MPRWGLLFTLVLIAWGFSGCERGCASRWMSKRKEGVGAVPEAFRPARDCPDGLARCVGGVVESSELARIPQPCKASEGQRCDCPWTTVADCPHGCLAEGVEVVAAPDRAARRLCADPMDPRDAQSLGDEDEEKDAGP